MDKLLIFSNMGFFLCSILLFNEQQYVSGLMLLLTGIILTEFQINKCLDDCSEPIINKEKIILAISFALYLTIIKKQSIGNTGLYLLSLGVLQILAHKKGDNYKIFSSLWTILFAYGFYLLNSSLYF